jgi:hypothetical protein
MYHPIRICEELDQFAPLDENVHNHEVKGH